MVVSLVMRGKQPSLAASRGDDVFVDGPGDAVVGAGDLAVAGVGPGPASLFLPVGLLDRLDHVEADPATCAGTFQGGGGGRFDGEGGAHPGLG
jgi:hypothetical protein